MELMNCKANRLGQHNTMVKIAKTEATILSHLSRITKEIDLLKEEVMKLRQEARKQARSNLEAETPQSTKSGFIGKPIC